MQLLLDTHVLIWFITDDPKLPTEIKSTIENPTNHCLVSIASLWEMAIKHSLGRLELKAELPTIFELIEESGFVFLPITPTHILANASLPFHHRDPFDRLIIAQSQSEELTLISRDPFFKKYPITLFWSA